MDVYELGALILRLTHEHKVLPSFIKEQRQLWVQGASWITFLCMQFKYNPSTLFHKYDSLHKGSKPTLGKLKILITEWNLPKAIEGVKAGIKTYLWKKCLELLSTEICHKNCQRTQQETLNGLLSLQTGTEMVQQHCHKVALIRSIDLVVVVSLHTRVHLFSSFFLYHCWPHVLEASNHYLCDIFQF